MYSKLLLVAFCAVILGFGDSSEVAQEGSQEFQDQNVTKYNCPEYGVDFLYNDIDFAIASTWQDCGKICQLYNGCYFWTYRTNDNTCCLKSSDDGLRKVNEPWYSGTKFCIS